MATPIIYLIRHGEKPPKLPNGEDADGLSAQGLERANALPQVFGKGSLYNIGHILAEHPKKDGNRSRPYDTVLPLSKNLGLTINDTIDRDDVDGAAKAAKVWTGPGNVLVCWEHGELAKIAEAIGVKNFAKDLNVEHPKKIKYPSDRFDIIWTVTEPYDEIVAVTSEGIKGLDDGTGAVPGPVAPVTRVVGEN